jgi:hypothetical protein
MLRTIRIDQENAETILRKLVLKYETKEGTLVVNIGEGSVEEVSYDADGVAKIGESYLASKILDHIRKAQSVFDDGNPLPLGKRLFRKYPTEKLEGARKEIDDMIARKKKEEEKEKEREELRNRIIEFEEIKEKMRSAKVESMKDILSKIKEMRKIVGLPEEEEEGEKTEQDSPAHEQETVPE